VVRRTPGEVVRAEWSEEEQQVVRVGEITERVLGEYPLATLGRVTAAERAALEAGHTTNEGNVIVIPVNTAYTIEDVQAVRLAENFSMLAGNRRPDGAIVAAAFCFREPSITLHEAENMVVRWGFPIPIVQADGAGDNMPEDGDDLLTCPSCGATTDAPATECSSCGFSGPPFSLTPAQQRQLNPSGTQPIAITVNIDGQQVTAKGGVEPGKYVYLKCPECGLIQDADHDHCTRCGHDLTEARRGMFAEYEQKGEKPPLHSVPPPPASKQPDLRKDKKT
jgi:ribosomal protein L37E